MKYYRIIRHVLVMAMAVPVGSLNMYLDVAAPHIAADLQLGIEEIRACITIVETGVNDLHPTAVDGRHIALPATVYAATHSASVSPSPSKVIKIGGYHKRFTGKLLILSSL